MNAFRRLRACRWLAPLALAGAVAAGAPAVHAEAPPWPESPFSYIAKEPQLDKVLAGFAKTFGLELRLETNLPESLGAPSGRSVAATPTEFLNQIGATYGLTWYYHAGALYVSRSADRTTRLVPTKGMTAAALKRAFTEMGILDTRFGWGEVDERSAVLVSGPRSYVERIEKAMAAFSEPPAEQQILVFRLKYASVDDRTIVYRDKQIVTPGVTTMLRSLLGDPGTVAAVTEVAESRGALKPLGPEGNGAASTAGASAPAAAAKGGRPPETARAPRPVIQSDPRLNAILIKDRPQNAAIYRELIETLDVPSHLIEIEAAIVDVNTSSMAELGVDWSGRSGRTAARFGDPAAPTEAASVTLIRGAANPTTVISDAANFLLARVKFLESKGNARIVSRPFILTQDNMGALIDLSDTFYVQTAGERVASVTPVSVGVTLRVTPRIVSANGTRSIQLTVDIEDGLISEARVGGLPTVRRSTIGTQAVMGENHSLLIGGFNTENTFRQKEQVPVLGDIPAVGLAFSKTNSTVEKSERLFLITPKIVTDQINRTMSALPPVPVAAAVPAAPAEGAAR
jgi:type III secretion protein C